MKTVIITTERSGAKLELAPAPAALEQRVLVPDSYTEEDAYKLLFETYDVVSGVFDNHPDCKVIK